MEVARLDEPAKPGDNPPSIADRAEAGGSRHVAWVVFCGALFVGIAAAIHYAWSGLTLSHYDARAHLVVARRIVDSLTPGWQQIGGVWLPLPHVLGIPAVWSEWGYRTGYPAVAVSIVAMALGLARLAGLIQRRTGSTAAALAAPALIVANPNVLYLASTPMTEPLLLGLAFASVAAVALWIERDTPQRLHMAGVCLAALTLTRYEGWLVAGTLVAAALIGTWRARRVRAAVLACYVGTAVLSFLLLSRFSTGAWFVTGGFFVVDPSTYGSVSASASRVLHSTAALAGRGLIAVGGLGVLVALWGLLRRRPNVAIGLALFAAGALPFYAFFEGHPHRIRYMVPLVAACGFAAAAALAALPRRVQPLAAAGLVVLTLWERPPLDSSAPMVLEAQWETPFRVGRRTVTAYLTQHDDGTPVLASMGSLAHYMQEASNAGFHLKRFLHEGNGHLWGAALDTPRRHAGWVLVEERAEGGDLLFQRASEDTSYLAGFTRVAEGGGLALYRRTAGPGEP